MQHHASKQAFQEACQVLPGGVDSPVRAFGSVGGTPIFVDHALGAQVWDIDGNAYIDYIGSWGPMILGHLHPYVMENFSDVAMKGLSFGLPNQGETRLANLIIDAYPGMEMVRFVTSGTEATMSAIRVARGYTKRDKIIKFAGCYHGHHDALLVRSGSGAMTFAQPDSSGVPTSMVEDTIVCRYNELEDVLRVFETYPDEIAAIILEPIAGNMGVVASDPVFLQGLRTLCDDKGSLLIFDEVISGFRVAYGGAAQYYGITPDMACFGKIIGAGMSVGAYGGRKDIMQVVSPIGGVYQAGTLAGNPLAMHLGIRQLTYLKEHPEVYTKLEHIGATLEAKIRESIQRYHLPYQVQRVHSLLTIFFCDHPVYHYEDAKTCDVTAFAKFHHALLKQAVLCAPSQFEALFLSVALEDWMLEKTYDAIDNALGQLAL